MILFKHVYISLLRIICGHRHSQMLSLLLFCRTERDLNGEEDDYLPDLEGEQTIHWDQRNVPQGNQCNALLVTFRPTKKMWLRKYTLLPFGLLFHFTVMLQSHLKSLKHIYLCQLLPYLFTEVHFTTNLIHQSKTAHHWKELLTHHGKTPIDRMLQKKTFKIRLMTIMKFWMILILWITHTKLQENRTRHTS